MTFTSVQEMFCQAADRFGERVAVESAGRATRFAELEERSNQLARHLLASGAAREDVVALLLSDLAETIAAILACLKIGALFAPLEAGTPAGRLALVLGELTPRWLLTEEAFADKLSGAGEALAATRQICLDREVPPEPQREGERVLLPADPDARSYVFFTSGSSGRPKGIVGRLKGIDHFVRWEIETFGIGPETRVSQLASLGFDAVLRDIFVPLCAGGTVCQPAGRDVLLDPRRLAAWLAASAVQFVHSVPSLFRTLLSGDVLEREPLPVLRAVLLAGEPLLGSDVRRWNELAPHVPLINLYGPTETTMTKLFYRTGPADWERPVAPIGKAMPGAAVLVLDRENRPCTAGQIGEIVLRTPYRSHGYWRQPELTARSFVPNPFSSDPEDRVYRTGDLGRLLEDGNLLFLGREDLQVKVRGVRVELEEIENLLLSHPAVREAVVTAPDDGEGGRTLAAYVVPAGPGEPGSLREFLAGHLPEALIPAYWISLPALPRTLTGKVDRRALPPAQRAAAAGAPPGNPTEELLLGIFNSVLGVEGSDVDANFFERGGHSLMAIRVLARVQDAFGVELPLGVLFQSPTVASLARLLLAAEEAHGPRLPPLTPRPEGAGAPLSFAQQRLWVFDQIEPGNPAYNVFHAVRLSGPLATAVLGRAFNEIVRRHEALRTVFAPGISGAPGEPEQVILPELALDLPVEDLTGFPPEERSREAERLAAAEAHEPFDLARGPLLRVKLLRLAEREHVLTLTMHHIVSDALSTEIFVREAVALYRAYLSDLPSPLPALPVQYADFALWQRQWLAGEILAAELDYWKERLEGAPPLLELPTDHPRGRGGDFAGRVEPFALPPDLVSALKRASQEADCTLFMVLFAGFQILLRHLSGESDFVVGSPLAARNWVEIEGAIGLFVNALALRCDLSGEPTVRELLGRVRRQLLADYAHQHLPFDRLVEELRPERSLSYNPVFQVTFNFLDRDPASEIEIAGLTLRPASYDQQTTQFDLSLSLVDTGKGFFGSARYKSGLFERETIGRMLDQYRQVLDWMSAEPDLAVAEICRRLAEGEACHRQHREGELAEASARMLRERRRRPEVRTADV